MSSQIESVVRDLIGVNNTIGAIAVLDNNGRVIYTTENWKVNGSDVINSWRKKDPSVTIQSVKYSTLQTTEERLIATNVSGKGHIVMSTVGDKALLVAYVLPQGDAQGSYADVCRAADQIRRVI
jgi:predicted regulator of Ras-like GTPase activity (Roadblock/LC7/MglB family)